MSSPCCPLRVPPPPPTETRGFGNDDGWMDRFSLLLGEGGTKKKKKKNGTTRAACFPRHAHSPPYSALGFEAPLLPGFPAALPSSARKRTLFVIEGADSRSSSRSVSVCSRRFVALLKTAINPKKRRRDGIEREEEKEEETSPFIRLGFGEGASISLSHREGREPRITFHIASRLSAARREGGRERISKEEEDLSHLTNAALHRGTEGRREGDT